MCGSGCLACALAVLAGLPALSGLLLIVGGNATASSLEQGYGLDRLIVGVLRWPVALALGLGAGIALAFWMTFTGLLAVYFTLSGSFAAVNGQLTSIMALLLWAQLSSMAILFWVAFTAQLEAERAGLRWAPSTCPAHLPCRQAPPGSLGEAPAARRPSSSR